MAERRNHSRGSRKNQDHYQQDPYSQNQAGDGRTPYGAPNGYQQGAYQWGPYSQQPGDQTSYGQEGYQQPYGQPQGGYQQDAYGRQNENRQAYGQEPSGAYGRQGEQQQNYQQPYGQPQGGYQQAPYGAPNGYQQIPYGQNGGNYQPPKKKKKKSRIALFVVEVGVLAILAGGLFVFSKMNKMQRVDIKPGQLIVNEEIAPQEKEVMETYTNIALYGVDSREGMLTQDAHSDALLVASINNKTKDIKLMSVYRDTYLDNTNGEYRKATECYYFGGPERSMNMLNKNLDLDITKFFTVDFNVVADVVDRLGGLEIDVQPEEVEWINGYQTEGSLVTGHEIVPVTGPGLQTLNGLQTLSYCRIRYTTGDDFKRTERQRVVLEKILQKVKQDPFAALGLVDEMFSSVATNMTLLEITGMVKDIASYNLVDTFGFPFDYTTSVSVPRGSDCVVPVNLENNVLQLHQRLFGSEDYTPSETVRAISNQIINDTGAQ
jgi:LCP family protein required for cell wall assembly